MSSEKSICKGFRLVCVQCGFRHTSRGNEVCENCGESLACDRPVAPLSEYCADHGGARPTRGSYPDTKHFPLVKLAEKYNQMQSSARMLSLQSSIAVVRARIEQLAERIDHNNAPDRLAKIAKLWQEYVEETSPTERLKIQAKITTQINRAVTDFAAWEQLMLAMDLDRKLVESEVKVVKDIRAILTAEDAYELVAKLLAIILRVFPDDPKKLMQVQYEFSKLIGDRPVETQVYEDAVDVEGD